MRRPKYVVKNENTLGYIISKHSMGVLAGSMLRGGHHWTEGPVYYAENEIRPATREDFKAYKIMLPPDFKD